MTPFRLARDLQRLAVLGVVGALFGWVWNPQSWRSVDEPVTPRVAPVLNFMSPTISLDEARSLFRDGLLVVVDARQRPAFEQAHIPGAIAAWDDGARSLMMEVRRWLPGMTADARVVVVGTDARGFDSRRLAGRLRMTAAVQPQVLEGGMPAWIEAGLPTVAGWDMEPLLEGVR